MLKRYLDRLFGSQKKNRLRSASDRIRVVVELASFDKGGLEKVVLDQALSFNSAQFEVVIVTPGALGHLAAQARKVNLRVEQLPKLGTTAAYRALLRRIEPDVSISHFSDLGYPLFAELGIPNVTFIHNVYAFMPDNVRATFQKNDKYVTRYISVSNKASIFAEKNLGVSPDKVVTIPNGLIIAEHEQRLLEPSKLTRSDLGIRDTDYVFLNPASYNLHKGHYLMANSLKRILRERDDIKILCIGNTIYPPHVAELTDYIERNGLTDHMLMPGYYPAVQDPMRLADACLLPSFIEGWSIAMNEAMFYAKPMILTDIGGAAEVIENNDIGILLPTEYPDFRKLNSKYLDELAYSPRNYKLEQPLAEAMKEFADHREKWSQAGQLGRRKLLDRYDFTNTMRRYEEQLADVVAAAGQAND
ncbi:glycosyltransferase family 4 protein [Rhizobium sp. No.120]